MIQIKHILFPVDFSTQGSLAAPYVREYALRFGAKLTLLSVVPPMWLPPGPGPGIVPSADLAELAENVKKRLDVAFPDEFAPAGGFAAISVDRVIRSGDAAHEIADFVEKNGVDLIMMPTHGYGKLRALLLGSTTAKVLHDVRCPVWTAAHAQRLKAEGPPNFIPKSILVALDASPESGSVLQWANDFANGTGASLFGVHVIPSPTDWADFPGEQALQDRVLKDAGEKIEALCRSAGVSLPVRVCIGHVGSTVAEEVIALDADLVIVGRGAISGSFGLLRTHAQSIIHLSPSPVLSI